MLSGLLAMISDSTDKVLVRELFEKYEQMLYRVAYGILHDHIDAEDAVQDTFVKIIKNIEKIREIPCNETGFYLVIIVKNTARDMLRKKNRHPETDIDEAWDISSDCEVEEEALRRLDGEHIRQALSELSDDDYEVLYLRLVREYSPMEISQLIGVPVNMVRQRVYRARQRLIKLLEKRGVTNDF